MRAPVLILVAVALLGGLKEASAQGTYSYPWCSIDSGGASGRSGGSPSCAYDTREQCVATMSGIGGYCVTNPQYRAPAAPSPRHRQRASDRKHPL
jgi:hypothetical protein